MKTRTKLSWQILTGVLRSKESNATAETREHSRQSWFQLLHALPWVYNTTYQVISGILTRIKFFLNRFNYNIEVISGQQYENSITLSSNKNEFKFLVLVFVFFSSQTLQRGLIKSEIERDKYHKNPNCSDFTNLKQGHFCTLNLAWHRRRAVLLKTTCIRHCLNDLLIRSCF